MASLRRLAMTSLERYEGSSSVLKQVCDVGSFWESGPSRCKTHLQHRQCMLRTAACQLGACTCACLVLALCQLMSHPESAFLQCFILVVTLISSSDAMAAVYGA